MNTAIASLARTRACRCNDEGNEEEDDTGANLGEQLLGASVIKCRLFLTYRLIDYRL